jgi:hypothetical protein
LFVISKVSALLPVSAIDTYLTTKQLFIHQEDEKEIRADDQEVIYLVSIEDEKGTTLKKFHPPMKTNTGHSLFGGKS